MSDPIDRKLDRVLDRLDRVAGDTFWIREETRVCQKAIHVWGALSLAAVIIALLAVAVVVVA